MAMPVLAITAKTVVSACGLGTGSLLDALVANKSGLAMQAYTGLDFDTWLGVVDGIDTIVLEPELQHYSCRNNLLARMALDTDDFRTTTNDAIARYGADRIGLFMGTSTSGSAETEKAYQHAKAHGGMLPDDYQLMYTHNIASLQNYIQRSLGLNGPGHVISTACSSSAKVFAAAYRHIVSGQCDAAIVGGVDSLCLSTLYGFNSLHLVSDDICRPYDKNRKGINIGEAAGFVLLEPADAGHGKVKFKGYGESSDAYHMSSPNPDGDGAVLAMNSALLRAGLDSADIEYINLHGTATQSNDIAEAKGVSSVFGEAAICSSTKGYTGHTLGAAGVVEAIVSILALENNILPGNINLQQLDTGLGVRPLSTTVSSSIENVMTNNFGFGGSNSSMIFGW